MVFSCTLLLISLGFAGAAGLAGATLGVITLVGAAGAFTGVKFCVCARGLDVITGLTGFVIVPMVPI